VRAFLGSVLPDARITDAAINPEYRPVLLMQTKHVMAVFAFANGDMRQSYEALYGSFKKYYTEQQGQWDALDLTFVFCVHLEDPQLDQFCSSVETDVYFCRKFVIPLVTPLGASLARLPFLPLTQLRGQSLRPPSAQTFLQQCDVPAVLAKYLVVQHERSPEGIVEDCTTEKFGKPRPLTSVSTTSVVQPQRPIAPVRLEMLEIQNFRAYRKAQSFALGADITVLYGPNGFGKTSFFDAIDFAITGGIGRFESRRQSDFANTARHLDAASEESTVSLTFQSKGAVRKITRSVSDRKQAILDDRPTDRKTILTELTSGSLPATDRVENFVSLFRASHLFSQEQQELTKDFQDDCKLSGEIVSRMLALEDYANAVAKAAKVRAVVQNVIASAAEEIRILTEQTATDTKELDRLGQTAKAHANTEVLDKEIDTLLAKLETVGIAVTTAKPDATMLRGWRAALESRHSQSRAATERFSLLVKEVAGLPRMRAEIEAVQQQIALKGDSLKTAEEKRLATELVFQRAEQRLAEMTAKRVTAQTHADLLEWVRNTQPEYLRQLARQRELSVELQRATETLAQLTQLEDKAVRELTSREVAVAQAAEKLKTRRSELAAIQSLLETIPDWEANRERLTAVLQSEKAQINALELLRAEGRELAPQLAAVTAEEARLARQIAEADENQSELRTLISQLQGHVYTGTCPLCGEDHGSKDKLLQRIQNHVAADAASGARADLASVRDQVKQLSERSAVNKQNQQAADAQFEAMKIERLRLENEIRSFERVASNLGIVVEHAGSTPTDLVQALAIRHQQEVTDLDRLGQEAAITADAARATVANAKSAVAAKKAEVNERKSALSRTEEQSTRLRSDPRLTQISLDIEPGQLGELEKLNKQHVEKFKADAARAESESNQKKVELGMIRQEVVALKAQLAALRTQLSNLQTTATQITIRLQDSNLPPDTNEESMLALIAEQSRFQAQLLTIRDATTSLELAMDAATTAAALTTLQQTIRKREEAVAQAAAKRDRHLPWLKYFEDVSRLLSSQQNAAIANFTREYGPRTSVIQRRLRPVYGFEGIEIVSHDSTITVRVNRHGEELRPTDYFSQSQQQTLLLGLFLTACSSQTWSAFSPVFLDDPITHFDDLNTYALLDLLVGLLESEVEQRQFIISTCDENLLQLARQKFRHFGDRAKYYQFTSIGADGPTVDEIL
jgi:exonuclease SbcC